MKITFSNTEQDLLAFHKHHLTHTIEGRRFSRNRFVGTQAVALVCSLVLSLATRWPAGIVAFCLFELSYFIRAKREPVLWAGLFALRTLYEQSPAIEKEILLGSKTVEVSPEALSCSNPYETLRLNWRRITRFDKGSEHIFAYRGEREVFIIPLRAFQSAGEFNSFFETAVRYRENALSKLPPSASR